MLDRLPRRAEEETGQWLRSLFLGDQAVCVPSTATVDSHQAICTPEEAVGSCWAVGEQVIPSGAAYLRCSRTAVWMSPERLPIAPVPAWGTNMQDQRELRGTPGQGLPVCAFLSDLPEQAGGSLRQVSKDLGAPGRQSGDSVEWARPHSTLPLLDGEARISGDSFQGLSTSIARGPDPGEHSGAWGEFEGFRESSASSEQFSQSFELRERPSASQLWRTASAQKEHRSSQTHQGGVTGTGAIAPSEVFLESWPCCIGSVSYPVVGDWSGRGSTCLWAFILAPFCFPFPPPSRLPTLHQLGCVLLGPVLGMWGKSILFESVISLLRKPGRITRQCVLVTGRWRQPGEPSMRPSSSGPTLTSSVSLHCDCLSPASLFAVPSLVVYPNTKSETEKGGEEKVLWF